MQVSTLSAGSCFWFLPNLRKDFDSFLAQRRIFHIEKWMIHFSLWLRKHIISTLPFDRETENYVWKKEKSQIDSGSNVLNMM